jgi:GNAT superfamily N-acetyltransferase
MIDPTELAALEETRLATSLPEVADSTLAFGPDEGGGVACIGSKGSWVNTAVGLGMWGTVPLAAIDRLVEFYAGTGIEPRVEACPYAHLSLIASLADRGFVLRDYESVFARSIHAHETFHVPTLDGICIERLPRDNPALIDLFAQTVASGFAAPKEASAASIEITARCARHPRCESFAAFAGDRMVGAGSFESLKVGDRLMGALFSLSVHPDFRGKGIQSALIATRLEHASRLGCTLVTIGAQPGVSTQRNALRAGFQVMYTKAILVKPMTPGNPV